MCGTGIGIVLPFPFADIDDHCKPNFALELIYGRDILAYDCNYYHSSRGNAKEREHSAASVI
jgi:hypothetical protein